MSSDGVWVVRDLMLGIESVSESNIEVDDEYSEQYSSFAGVVRCDFYEDNRNL